MGWWHVPILSHWNWCLPLHALTFYCWTGHQTQSAAPPLQHFHKSTVTSSSLLFYLHLIPPPSFEDLIVCHWVSQHAAGCSVVIFHICPTLSKLCITIKDTYLQHEHHRPLQSFSCALTLDIPTNTHFSIGMKNAWLYEHCHCFTNAALFP